jgi:hypothetical protein
MHNVLEPTGEKIRQYLLGNLTDDHRAEIEQRLLSDEQFFEDLLISENELVDAYFAGRLAKGEKRQFETHFLVGPERQAKFRFGRVLNKYLESNDSTQPESELPPARTIIAKQSRGLYWPFGRPLVTVSVALAILIVASATYWLWSQRGSSFEARQQIAVSLMPGGVRSGGAIQRIEIKPDIGVLQLELGLATVDFPTYHAELSTEGKTVKVFDALQPTSKDGRHYVVVSMSPPDSGDYQIKLSGVASSGQMQMLNSYNFRVIKP